MVFADIAQYILHKPPHHGLTPSRQKSKRKHSPDYFEKEWACFIIKCSHNCKPFAHLHMGTSETDVESCRITIHEGHLVQRLGRPERPRARQTGQRQTTRAKAEPQNYQGRSPPPCSSLLYSVLNTTELIFLVFYHYF